MLKKIMLFLIVYIVIIIVILYSFYIYLSSCSKDPKKFCNKHNIFYIWLHEQNFDSCFLCIINNIIDKEYNYEPIKKLVLITQLISLPNLSSNSIDKKINSSIINYVFKQSLEYRIYSKNIPDNISADYIKEFLLYNNKDIIFYVLFNYNKRYDIINKLQKIIEQIRINIIDIKELNKIADIIIDFLSTEITYYSDFQYFKDIMISFGEVIIDKILNINCKQNIFLKDLKDLFAEKELTNILYKLYKRHECIIKFDDYCWLCLPPPKVADNYKLDYIKKILSIIKNININVNYDIDKDCYNTCMEKSNYNDFIYFYYNYFLDSRVEIYSEQNIDYIEYNYNLLYFIKFINNYLEKEMKEKKMEEKKMEEKKMEEIEMEKKEKVEKLIEGFLFLTNIDVLTYLIEETFTNFINSNDTQLKHLEITIIEFIIKIFNTQYIYQEKYNKFREVIIKQLGKII